MTGEIAFSVYETAKQLEESFVMLEWIVHRVPPAWHHRAPEGAVRGLRGDNRDVALHLAHLAMYEIKLANPVLEDLAKGGNGQGVVQSGHASWFLPDAQALSVSPINDIMQQLRDARTLHIKIVKSFDDARFNIPITSLWGTGDGTKLESAGWVATKTVQHTIEHANSVFRFTLFAPR